MDNAMTVHKLRYQVIAGSYPTAGQIMLGESILYNVKDMAGFYGALGYTEDVHKRGLSAEEFFWEEYRKDDSKFRPTCFSAKILKYLLAFSQTFKADNMDLLRRLTGSCLETALQEKIHCTHCMMNPSQTDL